jgi:hypothetical protein
MARILQLEDASTVIKQPNGIKMDTKGAQSHEASRSPSKKASSTQKSAQDAELNDYVRPTAF